MKTRYFPLLPLVLAACSGSLHTHSSAPEVAKSAPGTTSVAADDRVSAAETPLVAAHDEAAPKRPADAPRETREREAAPPVATATATAAPPPAVAAASPKSERAAPAGAAVGPRADAKGDATRAARLEAGGLGGLGVLAASDAVAARGAGAGRAATLAEPAMRAPAVVASGASVRAGEWNDNANYREFLRYIDGERGHGLHFVDVRDRQFLVVSDVDGRPVPGCPVRVEDAAGHATTLTTTASGRAILFPRAERLDRGPLTATATCREGGARASFGAASADGVVDLRLAARRALPQTRTIDVGFVLDTTGSMSEEIGAVKATLQKVAGALGQLGVAVNIGIVEYKDRGDEFVTRVHQLTPDVDGFARGVGDIRASGGGDTPESVNEGLHVGLTKLAWSPDSVAHLAFLVGDAPPHLDYPQDFDYASDALSASHRGIQVFTIAASGMDGLGQAVFRQIAQLTGATNMFVLRGGAGPQSTGAGDPKSSCGGTQTAYTSGHLDDLVVAKIRDEVGALDADPHRIAGLGQDENAKPCDQRLVLAR